MVILSSQNGMVLCRRQPWWCAGRWTTRLGFYYDDGLVGVNHNICLIIELSRIFGRDGHSRMIFVWTPHPARLVPSTRASESRYVRASLLAFMVLLNMTLSRWPTGLSLQVSRTVTAFTSSTRILTSNKQWRCNLSSHCTPQPRTGIYILLRRK